jgi:maltose O-acetyltransferase
VKSLLRTILRSAPAVFIWRAWVRASSALDRAASVVRSRSEFGVSSDVVCHWSVEVKHADRVRLGDGVIIGPGCTIGAAAPITLEDHVHLSKDVIVETGGLDFTATAPFPHNAMAIHIGPRVWIGARAIVLGGVRIGADAVVGAGTVVSRDVPPGTLAFGSPMSIRAIDRGSP